MAFGKLAHLYSKGLHRSGVTPIAVDFGSSSLKVLQITTNEPPELVCAGEIATPADLVGHVSKRLEYQIGALPDLVRKLSCKGRRAVCAIPSALTFCKHMQISGQEGLSPEILADTMLSEQTGRDAATLVRRLLEVEPPGATGSGRKNEYICLASGNEVVEKLIKGLRRAKLEVVGMHSEFEALLQAFAYVNKRESDKEVSTLYLDVGCCQSRVTIAHGRQLVFARIMNFGGMTLDEYLAKELVCPVEEARAYRLDLDDLVSIQDKAGVTVQSSSGAKPLAGEAVMVAEDRRMGHQVPGMSSELDSMPVGPICSNGVSLAEPLEILTDEISMCIRYHDSIYKKQPVGSIVFLGGEARHRGLCQHIARTLRLSARVSDPLARIIRDGSERILGVDTGLPQPGWAVAVGLCQSPTDL